MTDLAPGSSVTIGRPMHNCRVYVLGPQQERLMPTAVGELYLAGQGVSAGYIAREDLTAGAFFPDPFVPGQMMYKSGDLGRLRADGSLDCLGRCDAQVKINGQRLEIDEIVNTILDSGLVEQAVVVPVTGANSMVELHAFCTSSAGRSSGEITAYLREYLPGYMVPSQFHMLREMPFTPGGKADLTALKAMASQDGSAPACAAPQPSQKAEPAEGPIPAPGALTREPCEGQDDTFPPQAAPEHSAPCGEPVVPSMRQQDAAAANSDIPSATFSAKISVKTSGETGREPVNAHGSLPDARTAQAPFAPALQNGAFTQEPKPQAAPAQSALDAVECAQPVLDARKAPQTQPKPSASPQTAGEAGRKPDKNPSGVLNVGEILEIWGRVLGKQGLSPKISFFEQGGTSLDALS
ncbi:MAG: hypothetical protein ACLRVT_04710, partial [Oscillospiraceae bacterium]